MDPEGVMIVTSLMTFFLFVYLMIRTKHKHELEKLDRLAQGNADRSLTTGELENMIRDVVSEMTTPLKDQVHELSRRLEAPPDVALLDSEDAAEETPPKDKTLGRRTRA